MRCNGGCNCAAPGYVMVYASLDDGEVRELPMFLCEACAADVRRGLWRRDCEYLLEEL